MKDMSTDQPDVGSDHRQALRQGSTSHDVHVNSARESWELLRRATVGRLAVILDGAPDIFPVNYAVDHGTIVIRTAGGTKHGAARSQVVAFEVDGYDVDTAQAWSVVLKGLATEVQAVDEVIAVMGLPLDPWEAGSKAHFLRVTPGTLSGRRFRVAIPPVSRA
jgi:nitroimidazol reductase NimA-like FMN-containing flavoprotein (pyridoxamine 5'-phosphate oxidase superfamily)